MKPIVWLSLAGPLALVVACGQPSEDGGEAGAAFPDYPAMVESDPVATATLSSSQGESRGTATVTEGSGALIVTVAATGLEPGRYGLHIHTTGKCDAPDFKSAGGHWNPSDREHGFDNPKGSHSGDLPNLVIGSDGEGTIAFDIAGASVEGAGGLLDGDGAAIMIHAGPDDMMTDPSGDSGDRIACGVLAAPVGG